MERQTKLVLVRFILFILMIMMAFVFVCLFVVHLVCAKITGLCYCAMVFSIASYRETLYVVKRAITAVYACLFIICLLN